mmetsp:Transcript_19989/g.39265  ORF Transcript_19989/g.39265 Transcript_19989/m.39265 type:complete len:159 (-) Transcript_19989:399-875(-)|eukprot:CAMPEP_0171489160 /NCGR_PEP_ID=MMETSP0958-20121227/2602_1 /TAXON_ID=87120 /ORGANISM="Aurantiochytrium limacinum, Strain ATCCMYA-1381" /LENGTH=158 /DNA_ID=CAMNT_0012022341 /DNA_START=76 /DNA_END=552 /DNA_ORIENTATION=+
MTTILDLLPEYYGLVPLSLIVSTISVVSLGGAVMKARKLHKVEYPDMYATVIEVDGKKYTNAKDPESAFAFNSAQRGHQNTLESHYYFLILTVVGGLAAPIIASASLLISTLGCTQYARQYAEGGPTNRNNKLAICKYLGILGLLGCNGYLSYLLFTK